MCLASFVGGLSGVVGRQVRYAHPKSLRVAVNLALAADEVEKQERRNETFYTRSDEFAGQLPRSPGKCVVTTYVVHPLPPTVVKTDVSYAPM